MRSYGHKDGLESRQRHCFGKNDVINSIVDKQKEPRDVPNSVLRHVTNRAMVAH